MDGISPYHLAVGQLVGRYLDEASGDESQQEAALPQRDIEGLGRALLQEITSRESATHPALHTVFQKLKDHIRETRSIAIVVEGCLEQLQGLTTPDDLLEFVHGDLAVRVGNFTQVDAPERAAADCSSIMGMFLRQCTISFDSLSFEATCQLLHSLQLYLQEAGADPAHKGSCPQWMSPPVSDPVLQTPAAVDDRLNKCLAQAERQLWRVPGAALDKTADAVQALAPRNAKASLLRHKAAMLRSDFLQARDALHQYFDLSSTDGVEVPVGKGPHPTPPPSGRFQSALLSLGALHIQCGHIQEAMLSLNETVRIAQQHGDDVTLAHTLAALCHLLASTPPSATHPLVEPTPTQLPQAAHHSQLLRLLRRCLRRARQLQLPHLVAFAQLALAKFALQHHLQPPSAKAQAQDTSHHKDRALPATAAALQEVGKLEQATRLAAAVPHAPNAAGQGNPITPWPPGANPGFAPGAPSDPFSGTHPVFRQDSSSTQGASAEAVAQLAGSAHLLRGAAWLQNGSRSMAVAAASTYLRCYRHIGPSEDVCLAYAQLATHALAQHGYAAAQALVDEAREDYPHCESRSLAMARLAITHQRACAHRNVHGALQAAANMAALASPTDSTHLELRQAAAMEAELASAEALIVGDRHEEAAAAAYDLFELSQEAGQQEAAVRSLLLLGRVHLCAGAPLAALPHLLAALHHSSTLHFGLLHAEAVVGLAEVWLSLGRGHALRSLQQLQTMLPCILAEGDGSLRARALRLQAECLMINISSAQELTSHATDVLQALSEAAREWEELENFRNAAEAKHVAALVCDATGDSAGRNKAAAASLQLSQQVHPWISSQC
ncbi:hypothetical protein WJX74_005846 [Apatococcus lobatus]|uniref:Anaphase-promoting complex subunit 5 n=1 Tax=Apatococcus lobatus TaxID=904363 RepID=A0AAW1QL78_9CHLO